MTDLSHIRDVAGRDQGLAVVAVPRDDGSIGASVVNASVLAHPVDGADVVAFVSGAASRRLEQLRAGRPITVTFRAGWKWVSVEGHAEIVGPDDPHPHLRADALPGLLRAIFTAPGERTTTGPPTTKRWQTSGARQFSSGLDASTPTLQVRKCDEPLTRAIGRHTADPDRVHIATP